MATPPVPLDPFRPVTLDDFRKRFPIFEETEDDTISALIEEATGQIDTSWRSADYRPAIMYLTAHLTATDNSADTDAVEIGAAGSSGAIASESFGGMSISYASGGGASSQSGSLSSNDQYGTTEYGRRYLALLRKNVPAVLAIS